MKFLHIADLHLGKRVCEYSMLEDQKEILGQVVSIAVREGVSAVLIAGDVYDRTLPPAEATVLLSDFLGALNRHGIAVYMIAGNHDSGERLAFAAPLLEKTGVFLAGECEGAIKTFYIDEAGTRVAVHLLPHFRPAALAHRMGEERFEGSEAALGALFGAIDFSAAARHVLLAHLFVSGSETSESELPVIGTVDAVPTALFAPFDYVALGHLHRPQSFADKVFYAGSPLSYSFSEVGQDKSVVIVEIEKEGVKTHRVPLVPPHPMREVRGSMRELMAGDYSEDYIRATVTDDDVPPDARITLRTVYPNLMRFAVSNALTESEEQVDPVEGLESRDPLSLFAEFFEAQNGEAPKEAHLALMREILKEAEVVE